MMSRLASFCQRHVHEHLLTQSRNLSLLADHMKRKPYLDAGSVPVEIAL